MTMNVQDATFIQTKALPAAGAAAATDPIDTGARTARGDFLADVEFRLTVPATPSLVDTKTITYSVETDNDVAFGSAKVINPGLVVSTGAGGAGAAAVDERFRLPTDVERYVRVKATVEAGGGDNTGVSMTFKALF